MRWLRFSRLLAIGLLTAASAGARGAFAADAPASPEEAYFNTLAVMHAIPNAPFLRFDYHFSQVASGMPDHAEDWHAVERTEDGRRRLTDDRGQVRQPGQPPFFLIRPDLFLKPPVAASPQQFGIVTDTPYKVIGSTHTRTTHYDITEAAAETSSRCPGATHLRLRPKAGADPFYYNLRDLWIAHPSGRICKAIAVWHAGNYFGHRFTMEFTLDVAAETGLIDRWSTTGTARNGPFASRYRADGLYANVRTETSAPAGLFDR